MNAAAFLDRDNTIIRNDGDLGDPAKVELIQGAAAAIASLCGLGYRIIVVTNQGGVARGRYGEEDVKKVHDRIAELVDQKANGARIDAFYYCPYHPEGSVERYKREHEDRKPQPGMLLRAAKDFDIDLAQSWMIGDQMRDVEAGLAAGCRTILLKSDASRLTPLHADEQSRKFHRNRKQQDAPVTPEYVAPTLIEAVRIIAQQRRPDFGETGSSSRLPQERRWDAAAVARLQQQQQKRKAPATEPQIEAETKQASPSTDAEQTVEAKEARDNIYRPKGPVKPFRPPGSPQPETDEPEDGRKPPSSKPASGVKQAQPPKAAEPAPKASESKPAASKPTASKPAAEKQAQPAPAPESSTLTATPSIASDQARPAQPPVTHSPVVESPETNRLLQQIISELRRQRGVGTEFSWLTILAMVLQGIALLCIVAGLWMGAAQPDLFLKWVLSGLVIQGATIAALLFARHFE